MHLSKIITLGIFISMYAAVCWSIELQNEAIIPVTMPTDLDAAKIAIGKKLFNDVIFAKDKSLSCASCHAIGKAGTNNLPKYMGLDKKPGLLQTPTVLNASLNFRQFWDGRARTLGDAITDHLQDPTIFNNNWDAVIQRVNEDKSLKKLFTDNYPDNVNARNIRIALSSYLKTLVTPNSPFDRYLKGQHSAISKDAEKGYQLFKQYGCISCHEGANMGGNLFQRMGIYKDYFAGKKISTADLGRFNVTGNPEDKFVFKVPSLRNIALTSPYLHDGSAQTLEDVVEIMGIYEIGQPIPQYEVNFIVKFLESLTGELPNDH